MKIRIEGNKQTKRIKGGDRNEEEEKGSRAKK